MKYSTSRDKLSQMHEALDRELEMAGHPPLAKNKRDRDDYRFLSEQDQNKKSTLSRLSNKPIVYQHEVRAEDIKTKKNQISQLERKLMELQKKMDNFSVSSGDQVEAVSGPTNDKLNFKSKADIKPNEDTARFLIQLEAKERVQTKFSADYPAFADEEEEQEEDSQQYFQIQQAIIKRKAEQRASNQRKSLEKLKQKEKLPIRLSRGESRSKKDENKQDTDRKISVEAESVLRPKYSNQKSNRSNKNIDRKSNGKGSVRQSIVSKKSIQKEKKLPRTNSRRSLTSNQSAKRQVKNAEQKNNRSFDRSEEDIGFREQEALLAKELKKASNLDKQLQHYKRLARKLKQQVQGYKVMEIQFRQLKKNFAKSEAIRVQQKKIIQTLKSKVGR